MGMGREVERQTNGQNIVPTYETKEFLDVWAFKELFRNPNCVAMVIMEVSVYVLG